ncbi:hypothetical protein AAHH80_36050, partial [Burkholderia pseudomallei]
LSLTLEMPFTDNANLPDEHVGRNGARSASLGAAMLGAILEHVRAFARARPERSSRCGGYAHRVCMKIPERRCRAPAFLRRAG